MPETAAMPVVVTVNGIDPATAEFIAALVEENEHLRATIAILRRGAADR